MKAVIMWCAIPALLAAGAVGASMANIKGVTSPAPALETVVAQIGIPGGEIDKISDSTNGVACYVATNNYVVVGISCVK